MVFTKTWCVRGTGVNLPCAKLKTKTFFFSELKIENKAQFFVWINKKELEITNFIFQGRQSLRYEIEE